VRVILFLILLKSHVRDDARDDVRHHRAPSWQPSNTPLPKTDKLRVGCARSSIRVRVGTARGPDPQPRGPWVGAGRDAVGRMLLANPLWSVLSLCHSSPRPQPPPGRPQVLWPYDGVATRGSDTVQAPSQHLIYLMGGPSGRSHISALPRGITSAVSHHSC
jgi:hypothetical protein